MLLPPNIYNHTLANSISHRAAICTYITLFRSDFVRQPVSDFGRIDKAHTGGRRIVGGYPLDGVFYQPGNVVLDYAQLVAKSRQDPTSTGISGLSS